MSFFRTSLKVQILFMVREEDEGLVRDSLRGWLGIVEGMLVGGSLGEGSFEGPFGGPFGGEKVFKLGFNGSLLVASLAGASWQMVNWIKKQLDISFSGHGSMVKEVHESEIFGH